MTDYEIEQTLIKEGITDPFRIKLTIEHMRRVGIIPEVFFSLPGETPDFTKKEKHCNAYDIDIPDEMLDYYKLTPEEEEEMREAEEEAKAEVNRRNNMEKTVKPISYSSLPD